MKANVIFGMGVIVTAFGAMFVAQGANLVRWPAESFMVGNRDWIEYGIVVAMIGIGLLLAARRIKQG